MLNSTKKGMKELLAGFAQSVAVAVCVENDNPPAWLE
jgi:NaMN:DMB phosphoribosyltransferase